MMLRASAAGLEMVALTDHDTTAGISAAAAALPCGLRLVPGMELSCLRDGHSVHLLAYLFDSDHPELTAQTGAIRESRVQRAKTMAAKLAALGTGVTWEQVSAIADGGVIGRPHLARALVDNGVIGSVAQAFTPEWIGPGGRAYAGRYALDPAQAVSLVSAAGGVSVLAHPFMEERGWRVHEDLITELAGAGLAGVEVAHPGHDAAGRAELADLVRALGLVGTGGSDDHGELTGDRIGTEYTSGDDFEQLIAGASGAQVIAK
jgi:predicted metal-dependent phosphoesterase TrpH